MVKYPASHPAIIGYNVVVLIAPNPIFSRPIFPRHGNRQAVLSCVCLSSTSGDSVTMMVYDKHGFICNSRKTTTLTSIEKDNAQNIKKKVYEIKLGSYTVTP